MAYAILKVGSSPGRAAFTCNDEARRQDFEGFDSSTFNFQAFRMSEIWRLSKLAESEDVENFAKGLEATRGISDSAICCDDVSQRKHY